MADEFKTPVTVSKPVLDGILAVRESGMTNMFDYEYVTHLASELGFEEAHIWLTSNKKLYSKGIFCGFECSEEVDPESLN